MAARKIKDAVCVIAERPDGQGGTKPIWKNVGALFEGDNGMFLILDMLPVMPARDDSSRGGLIIKFFDPRERSGDAPQRQARSAPPAPASGDYEDDIPF